MSTYVVERIKQATDCMVSECVSPLVRHTDTIETVLGLLGDMQSRQAYQRELIYMGLVPLLGMEKSHAVAGNFSDQIWANAVKLAQEMKQRGELPKLDTNFASDSAENIYLNTVHFALQQYIYKNIVINENDVVLGVGAGFGHASFWAESKKAAQIFAFEPNPEAHAFLEHNVAANAKTNIYPQRMLIAAEKGTVKYRAAKESKSQNKKNAKPEIAEAECISLDVWCQENLCKPDFIKISSENPLAVIAGAKETLVKNKPRLAVTIGSKLNYMWEVPLAVKNLLPEYTLFCRKNAPYGEFILYAAARNVQ